MLSIWISLKFCRLVKCQACEITKMKFQADSTRLNLVVRGQFLG